MEVEESIRLYCAFNLHTVHYLFLISESKNIYTLWFCLIFFLLITHHK